MIKQMTALGASTLLVLTSNIGLADNKGFSINPGLGYIQFDSELKYDDETLDALGVEYRFENNFAIEGNFSKSDTQLGGGDTNIDFQQARIDGLYYFREGRKLQPYLAAGVGDAETDTKGADANDETLLNVGFGAKYFFNKALSLRGDMRTFNSQDNETTSNAAVFSLAYLFGTEASSSSRRAKDLEISKAPAPVDTDKDGVFDDKDICLNTPAGVSIDAQGCPVDSDLDGIADYLDKCAQTPSGAPVSATGCPTDVDADGIADYQDKCPNTPSGVLVNSDGCKQSAAEKLAMDVEVKFGSNSSELPKDFLTEVEEIATFMKRFDETIAVIEGHTDSAGSAAYNKKLSELRAAKIRNILVNEFGIAPARIKAVGYGEERPVANNTTPEGRSKNRRVIAVVSNK